MARGVDSKERTPVARQSLVGRARELDVLAAAVDAASSGSGRLVVIEGEPGIGKTRLADEVAALARERGAVVTWGRCWEGGGAPAYWPWVQVVRSLSSQLGEEELLALMGPSAPAVARIVPEIGRLTDETAPLQSSGEQDRFAVFDALTTLLRTISNEHPVVLVLDDLHAADEASLQLLLFMGRGLRDTRTLVVGTLVENAAGASPGSDKLISTISREGEVIRLRGLDEQAVADIYEAQTGQAPSPPTVAALVEATEGNPYFVGEAVRLEASDGDLRRPDLSLGFRVPKGAREVMQRKLAPLSNDALAVVSGAAVIGKAFEARLLSHVGGVDPNTLVGLLSESVGAGVLKETGRGSYEFTHALLRETLYEDLGAADRMRIHSLVATALEDWYRNDLDARIDQLAHHCFKAGQAGDDDKALSYLMRAAEKARAATAYEEAARLYQRALKVAEWAGVEKARRRRIASLRDDAKRRVSEGTPKAAEPTAITSRRLVREGDYWGITYGADTVRIKDSKGVRYLVQLLKNPHKEIHVLELVAVVEGTGPSAPHAPQEGLARGRENGEVILDAEAKANYKRRIQELGDELEEARAYNDPERAAKAQAEIDALVEQLASGLGLGGRDRSAASAAERARVNITKALRGAASHIANHHPSLGHHVQTTVRTGMFCSYRPDPASPQPWEFR